MSSLEIGVVKINGNVLTVIRPEGMNGECQRRL